MTTTTEYKHSSRVYFLLVFVRACKYIISMMTNKSVLPPLRQVITSKYEHPSMQAHLLGLREG